jgi:hypothetical protein
MNNGTYAAMTLGDARAMGRLPRPATFEGIPEGDLLDVVDEAEAAVSGEETGES